MKKIKLFILLTFILCTSYTFGQKAVFKVLATSGNNLKGSTALTVGTVLNSDEQITVGSGDYLILMHLPQEAGAVQITNPGIYATNALAEYIETAKTTSGGKFVDYIIGEGIESLEGLNHSHANCVSKERCFASYEITILLPEYCFTMDPKVVVKWLPLEGTTKYLVRITDIADNLIRSVETNALTYVLDIDKIHYPDPDVGIGFIGITILSKEDATKTSANVGVIYKSEESEALKPKHEAFQALNSKSNESEILKKLYEAFFFEENKAYIDALRCYQEVIDMQPESQIYNIIYSLFLKKRSYIRPNCR